jgi:UDP-N-acetylglucosamine--N-acetylmuramyl-(pentapeptide) pyrophosphoryl-undecaprenol N-acetylglucosamine transferase
MKIVFTGGGTAGHVTPNLAIMHHLNQHHPSLVHFTYIGSHRGIEKDLVSAHVHDYHGISTGKLRRYKSWRNLLMPFQVMLGISKATWLCWRQQPDLIFSKGGFVAFPVVIAGFLLGIPVMVHESDLTPGLANKLSYPFAKNILVSFKKTQIPQRFASKRTHTGAPIRPSLLIGDAAKGQALCGFEDKKPCILVMGGSTGSVLINRAIRSQLSALTKDYQVIHLCGKGHYDASLDTIAYYAQFEYADETLPDLLAYADAVISRAGANSIAEWLALRKPHLLIPLSQKVSRGDQIANARHMATLGTSLVCLEEDLSSSTWLTNITTLIAQRQNLIDAMSKHCDGNGTKKIAELIAAISNMPEPPTING